MTSLLAPATPCHNGAPSVPPSAQLQDRGLAVVESDGAFRLTDGGDR